MGRLGRGAFSDHSFGDDASIQIDALIPLGRLAEIPTPLDDSWDFFSPGFPP
jgi:hypothetical protein